MRFRPTNSPPELWRTTSATHFFKSVMCSLGMIEYYNFDKFSMWPSFNSARLRTMYPKR